MRKLVFLTIALAGCAAQPPEATLPAPSKNAFCGRTPTQVLCLAYSDETLNRTRPASVSPG